MMQGYILFAHFDLCLLGVRIIVIKQVQNYEKTVFIKNIVEKWQLGDAYSSPLSSLS